MAERMTVVVTPTGKQSSLTIEDAMRQVLVAFELLSSTPSESGQNVVWRLVEAKTNSPPFSVTAEAASALPGINVDREAREQKRKLRRDFDTYRKGQLPEAWQELQAQRIASELIDRLRHGVTVHLDDDPDQPPILLTEKDAELAEKAFERPQAEPAAPKAQMGSVEGTLLQVTTYWYKPALIINERKTDAKVVCVITQEQSAEIAKSGKFEDVWAHRRVTVRGLIRYGKNGQVKSVAVTSVVVRPEPVDVPVEKIRDKDFTQGMTAADYLERLREGELG